MINKRVIKEAFKTAKLVTFDFPKEVVKRAIVPGYADRKIFGDKKKK